MDASNESAPDKELWQDFVSKGCEDSFDALMQRYKLKLFDLACRVLHDSHAAEDVVQQVFIRLLERRNESTEIESLRSWLYRTAVNLSLDMMRSTRRRRGREEASSISSTPETPREAAVNDEARKELDLALEKLKTSSRIPIVLRYLHGLSHGETSQVLRLSPEAVRSRIRRGLKRLRKLLRGRGLLVSIVLLEEGLRALPAKAASASFLKSATPVIKAASAGGVAAKAAMTTTSVVKGGLIMTAKMKIGIGVGAAVVAALVLILTQLPDRLSGPERDDGLAASRRRGPARTAEGEAAIQKLAESERPRTGSRFGMLGSAGKVSEWHHHLASALRWMGAWGHGCVVVAPPGADEASLRKTLQAEGISAETCSFEEASKRFRVLIVHLGAEFDGAAVSKLKSFAASGGWLIVSGNQMLAGMVAGLTPGSVTSLGSNLYSRARGVPFSEGRFLAAHPVLSRCTIGDWFPAWPLSGEVEPSKPGAGLWLMAFQKPLCPGIRILPVEKGGIVDIAWEVRKGGSKLGGVESREILHNTVDWLAKKETWRAPERVPTQHLVGKVVDEEGSPIAKALVAARVFSDWGDRIEEIASETDEDGDFSLAAAAPSVYWFEALAEGFLAEDSLLMVRCEEGDEQTRVRIVMRRTVGLFGTVCYDGQERAPAPGFPVKLLPSDRYTEVEPQETVSDQQGRFAFDNVPFGKTFVLVSQKEEWGGWQVVELPLDPEEELRPVVLGVERLPLVYGQVVEHKTLRPVPRSCVHSSPVLTKYDRQIGLFTDKFERTEKCDEDGGFSFHPLPGEWSVFGGAEGYAVFMGIGADSKASARLSVASGRAEPESPIVLEMEFIERKKLRWPPRGTQFYGEVYFPTGEPAPEAFVDCEGYLSRSDSQGRYETEPFFALHGISAGGTDLTEFRFEARSGDFVCQQSVLFPFSEPPPERYKLDLYLEEGEDARGFVRDRKGRPVEGAEVAPVTQILGGGIWWPGPKTKGNVAVSEADGSFTLSGLVPRSRPNEFRYLRLRAKKMDASGKYVGEVDLRMPEKEPIEDLVIVVTKERVIRGTVSYHDGTPLRNQTVEVSLRYGENREGPLWDQRGRFASFDGYLDDRGGFSISLSGFRQKVNLEEREVDPENWHPSPKKPPDSYEVWVEVEETYQRTTAALGNGLIIENVDVDVEELDVRFPPLGSICWRVVDGDTGALLERCGISAMPCPPRGKHSAETCWSEPVWYAPVEVVSGKQFHLVNVAPRTDGSYRVIVSARGYCNREFEGVRVEGNRTTDLGDVPLYRNWWVRGRVVAADNRKPVAASIEGPPGVAATTDAEGRFELTMSAEHRSCEVKVIPLDKAWQDASIKLEQPWQPVADVGDILLKPIPSENP